MGGISEQPDLERIDRVSAALERSGIDVLVCALPTNVLLISGYWPVIGTSVAVVNRNGFVHLLVPEDEEELAQSSAGDAVETLAFGSLADMRTAVDVVRVPLKKALHEHGSVVIGCETGPVVEPASYVGMHLFGGAIHRLLTESLPDATIVTADEMLRKLRSVLTSREQIRVREACAVAQHAFLAGTERLRSSLTETEAASLFRASLSSSENSVHKATRKDGFVFCMSGPNSAAAYAAYQRSRSRTLTMGDLVLIHCNSYVDGYWTDITRTFCLGGMDVQKQEMYEAVLAARDAALAAIRPGVRAAAVDRAARIILAEHGFAKEFKHGLGHGVGLSAINHNARPRLHPASNDVLEPGMVFNIEPAIYIDGFGGLRHCDMVLLTNSGPEMLTPFQATVESLTIH